MKEENVNDILIYDESGEEICEVPFYSVSDLVKNSKLIDKILKRYYKQLKQKYPTDFSRIFF
jgi:hypothetical protein